LLSSLFLYGSFPFFSIKPFCSSFPYHQCIHRTTNYLFKERDSVVGIATRLRAGWSRGSNPARDKVFFPSKNSRPCRGPTEPRINLYLGSFPSVKRLELDADHSSHELPRLRMSGCISLLPTTRPHGVDKEKVHFSFSSWLNGAFLVFWDLLVRIVTLSGSCLAAG
jgi:hypothetical protein